MSEPEPIVLEGLVEAVLLSPFGFKESKRVTKIRLIRGHGVQGDYHAVARLADIRESELLAHGLPKNMEIANHREVSIVSTGELRMVRERLALSKPLKPEWFSANLAVSGIPELSCLPSGTLLCFKHGERVCTAMIAVWRQNTPCSKSGAAVASHFTRPNDIAARFENAAEGLRGVVGSIYASGVIEVGDTVHAYLPPQHAHPALKGAAS